MEELRPISPNSTPRSHSCWSVFDIANKARKIEELEQQASQPDFWNDPSGSQAVMK